MLLIPALNPGGAERQVVELIKGLDKAGFEVTLATFYDGGALRSEVEQLLRVRVISLHKHGPWDLVPFLWRFWRVACNAQPEIMHGYMSLASNLCLLVGRVTGAKVAWSLRASNVDHSLYGWRSHWIFRVGAWLSHFADLIIVNSQAGRKHYVAHGYSASRMVVIPNGIDTEHYRPDLGAGQRMRLNWGIAKHETVIGLVGRLDGIKDHPTFLRAAAQLAPDFPGLRFVCVGTGPELYATELRVLAESLGLKGRLVWAGVLSDMPAVYNALDILSSSSYSEGFPNVIGEAMACGVPCVVTDVGDSAMIVGEIGIVVPARNPEALAEAWRHWLCLSENERRARSARARLRIEREFNLSAMIRRTQTALEDLLIQAPKP